MAKAKVVNIKSGEVVWKELDNLDEMVEEGSESIADQLDDAFDEFEEELDAAMNAWYSLDNWKGKVLAVCGAVVVGAAVGISIAVACKK